MKQTRNLLFLILMLLLTSCSIMSRSFYATDPGHVEILPQNFNVIFYGVDSPHDPESAVILDIAGDDYKIIAAASPFSFSKQDNLSSLAAETAATTFLQQLLWLNRIDTLQIITPDGKLIGYELRPIFHETQVNNNDFNSWYVLNKGGNQVKFYISWDEYQQPMGWE